MIFRRKGNFKVRFEKFLSKGYSRSFLEKCIYNSRCFALKMSFLCFVCRDSGGL